MLQRHCRDWQNTIEIPKLFEYFGIIVFFYSNEHDPVHVHGRCQGRESRAELVIQTGKVTEIKYSLVKGKQPLNGTELRDFQVVTEHYANEIVQRWIDYFILHKPIAAQRITRRIR
jgi:hypothetical protein